MASRARSAASGVNPGSASSEATEHRPAVASRQTREPLDVPGAWVPLGPGREHRLERLPKARRAGVTAAVSTS